MVFFRFLVVAGASALFLILSPQAQARIFHKAPPHSTSHSEGQLNVGEMVRTYRLYVPQSYAQDRQWPLVIALHGGGGSGKNMEALTVGGFNELAEKEGFLVAYPDAYKFPLAKRNWNDGRNVWAFPAQRKNTDDAGFISALIDELIKTYNVNPSRVYATGASNGGFMSFRLGCELSNKLAAIAPVIGLMAEPLAQRCEPEGPLGVLLINGKDDPLVPWQGGSVHYGKQKVGRGLSAEDSVRFWAKRNQCSGRPETALLPDADPGDGTRIEKTSYPGCNSGVAVELYGVEGGGHAWPGGYQYAGEEYIGKTSMDINACEVIWAFFKRHARR